MPNLIETVNHVVVLTGAGFSAPSGLPIYRASSAGWMDADLEQKSHAACYHDHLDELWPHWLGLARAAAEAEPNAAHFALARWERMLLTRDEPGSLTIVTQNVDGLHQRAGSQRVLEVHGSIRAARELTQGSELFGYDPDPQAGPPVSPDGSERTRPDIVLFGEKPRHMHAAEDAIRHADLLIAAGTSGRVWPVAGLPSLAREYGVPTLLLNREEWPYATFDTTVLDDVLALDQLVPQEAG